MAQISTICFHIYCIYPYKRPGGDAFFKRGKVGQFFSHFSSHMLVYYYRLKKNQLSNPVEMGDNGHLQPSSRLPACIIFETNLKPEEITKFYLILLQILMGGHGGRVVTLSPTSAAGVRSPSWPIKIAMFCCDFLYLQILMLL